MNLLCHLFPVETFRCVEGLNERRCVADEHRVARRTGQHADHGQPDVRRALRWVAPVADTQHVGKRLEERPRILFRPVGVLSVTRTETIIEKYKFTM